MFACVQAEAPEAARLAAADYAAAGFDGVAIGGLAPRVGELGFIESMVKTVRDALGESLPLHVFGIGDPRIVRKLFAWGADSVDSSSYARLAASGRSWRATIRLDDPSPTERLHLAICNLAKATGATLPFSSLPMVFSTLSLQRETVSQPTLPEL